MGIHALPADTVRTIGAFQGLHDAAAVVKELLDNAFDAHATAVTIEISSNTLDSIQVRDNGHGIPAVDRALVARPHCTSKISTENDLRAIGGSSLGFRGEALASIAELSGSLTITTRVEGEQIATSLKINQRGEIEGQDRSSFPVGTTVKATDFMKSNPVRKQVLLKSAEKTLTKVKHMLQSYAFARPAVRVSLRVIKAKNESLNWVYAPKPGANAEDVVLGIAGTRTVSQCTWAIMEDQGFTMQAFLPKADVNANKIGGFGSFLSVDSRPVSSSRGIPKQIAKIFREMLKKANPAIENVKDPFIYLQLSCPPASYDANVEPAKDDVLFEDPDMVLQLARSLFSAVYRINESTELREWEHASSVTPNRPARANKNTLLSPGTQAALAELSNDVEFEAVDIDENHPKQPAGGQNQHTADITAEVGSQVGSKAFRSSMYGCDEEDLDLINVRPSTGRTEADFEELRQARKDVNLSNPWVIAKLNAPRKRAAHTQEENQGEITSSNASNTLDRSTMLTARQAIDLEAPGLPTPRPSSPSPPRASFHPSDYVPMDRFGRDGRLIGAQAFPTPQQVPGLQPFISSPHGQESQRQEARQAPMYDHTLSLQASQSGTALQDIPSAPQRRHRANNEQHSSCNPPFKPSGKYQDWQERRATNRRSKKMMRPPRDVAGLVVQGELGDLVEDPRPLTPPRRNRDMRDFVTNLDLTADESAGSMIERRNYPPRRHANSLDSVFGQNNVNEYGNRAPPVGMLSGRGFVPASELAALEARTGTFDNSKTKPAKRRRTSEGRALTEIDPNVEGAGSEHINQKQMHPRERTISRRRSTAGGSRTMRSKSAQLPLERTPNGHAVQNLSLPVSTSEEAIARLATKIDEDCSIAGFKQAAADMYDAFANKPGSEAISHLTARLHELLVSRVSAGEMVQDLGSLLSDAFDAHCGVSPEDT